MSQYTIVEAATDDDLLIESNLDESIIDGRRNCHCTSGASQSLYLFCNDCCGIDENENHGRYMKYSQGLFELVLGVNYCYWFQVVIHNKFCNFLFKCGCTWNWDGGWKDCNVHNAEGPRCPWCRARANISWTTDYFLSAIMILTFVYLLSKRRKPIIGHFLVRLLAPILVYFVVGTIVGAIFLIDGYPKFIFRWCNLFSLLGTPCSIGSFMMNNWGAFGRLRILCNSAVAAADLVLSRKLMHFQ